MTLTSTTNRVQYDGDDSTVEFPITFVFWANADIAVVHTAADGTETTWVLGTQYTLSGGSGETGTLTVDTAPTDYTPATGEKLTIYSNLLDKQETALPAGGPFPSAATEQQLDKLVRLIQQKAEALGRAIKLKVSSAFSELTLPDPEADKVIGWNAGGTDLENKTQNTSAYVALPVSIANGGTGATTASAARTAFGLGTAAVATVGVAAGNVVQADQALTSTASATTTTLGTSLDHLITGTTTVTAFNGVAGVTYHCRADGAFTITHHATDLIVTQGLASITTEAGDTFDVQMITATTCRIVNYVRASTVQISGTFTPVLTFATPGDLSVAYSAQQGAYVKTGNLVTATFTITTSTFTHTTASGNLRVTGLPFTAENVTIQNWFGIGSWGGVTRANFTAVTCVVGPNTAYCEFIMQGSGQAPSQLVPADMPTGGTVRMQFTVTYKAA